MRVFDFDGTIYDGESLFDLYMFSARYEPKVLRHLAPVLRYAVQYKMGRATLAQMERGVGGVTCDYLHDVAASRRILRLDGIGSRDRRGRIRVGERVLEPAYGPHQAVV